MTAVLHADELPIGDDLVRALIDRDLPDLVDAPLRRLEASGSTNVLYRLGRELLVRLPRQPGSGESITKECRWSPWLAERLPVAIPEVVRVGRPGFGYPEPWSVLRWIEGAPPRTVGPGVAPDPRHAELATELADVVAALQAVDVPAAAAADPALRWYRGRPLAEFDADVRRSIDACREIGDLDLDLDAASKIWTEALLLPGAGDVGPDRWYHGDLVAENLPVGTGVEAHRLVALLDLGSLSVGDPTIDLHGVWELLDASARQVFRDRLDVDEPAWLRGRAWALGIALGTFDSYWDTMPGRRRDRLAMARAVLADAD